MTKHCLLAFALLTACSKDKPNDPSPGNAKPTEGAAATPTAKGATKLPAVGLEADIPGSDVMVSDGLGPKSQMVNTVEMGGLMVEVIEEAQTLEQVTADFEMMTPKDLKTETLPDGFVITFQNSGSMGTNHWVEVRRTIAGRTIKCSTMSDSAAKATAVVAACKSLR